MIKAWARPRLAVSSAQSSPGKRLLRGWHHRRLREISRQGIDLVGQFKLFEQFATDLLVILDLINTRGEVEMLLHGQIIKQAGLIGQESELSFCGDRVRGHLMLANPNAAARARNDP